jgi:hypothetical protein
MPIPITVNSAYDKVSKTLVNHLYWDLSSTSSLTVDDTIRVFRAVGSSSTFSNFEQIAELIFKANNYTDKDVFVGKNYYYLLYDSTEELPISTEAPPTVPILSEVPEPPEPQYELLKPLNFTVDQTNSRKINFSWFFDKENRNNIVIEYSINNNYDFETLIELPPWRISIELDDPNSTDIYYYRAYTKNKTKEKSEYSDIASLLSYAFTKAIPLPPTELTVIGISQTSVRLIWTNNNQAETGLEHLIYISTPGAPLTLLDSVLYDPNDLGSLSSYTATGLNKSTIYCFVCQARTIGGISPLSQPAEGRTIEQETSPNTPTSLSGFNLFYAVPEASNFKAQRLTWANPSVNNSSERYLIYSTNSNFSSTSSLSLSINSTYTDVFNLQNNTTYYYLLSSVNSIGTVSSTSASLLMPNPPDLPTALTATPVGQTTILLEWVDNATNEYENLLQISGGSYASYEEVLAIPSGTSSLFLENSLPRINLEENTKYNFLIYSVGAGGFSGSPSTWASATATTLGNVPQVPSDPSNFYLSGQVDIGTVRLKWTDGSGEDFFEMLVRTADTGRIIENITIPGEPGTGNSITYDLDKLVPDVNYIVNLRSKNSTGYSNYANVSGGTSIDLNVSTTPFVFLNSSIAIEASAVTGTIQIGADAENTRVVYNTPTVILSWNDPFNYGNGWKVYKILANTEVEIADLPETVSSFAVNKNDMNENYTEVYRVKKYLTTYGDKVYSSGLAVTASIGALSNGPEFYSPNNGLTPDLYAARTSLNTVEISWKEFLRTDIFELKKYTANTNIEEILVSSLPENLTYSTYTDTSAKEGLDISYQVVLTNSGLNTQISRRAAPPRVLGDLTGLDSNSDPTSIFIPQGDVRGPRTPSYTDVLAVTSFTVNQTGNGTVAVTWTAQPELGRNYLYTAFHRIEIANAQGQLVSSFEYNTATTSATYTGLTGGVTYYIRFTGISTFNQASQSLLGAFTLREVYSGEQDPVTPEFSSLVAVSVVSVEQEGYTRFYQGLPFRNFKIKWDRSSILKTYNINVAAYALLVVADDFTPPVSVFNLFAGTTTEYITNGLIPGKFTFYFAAANSVGTSSLITSYTLNFPQAIPTPVSSFGFGSTSRNQANLIWARALEAAGYVIQKQVLYNSQITETTILIGDAETTEYTDTDLIKGSRVTYRIASTIPGQESTYSNIITFNVPTDPEPPIAPNPVAAPRACLRTAINAGNVYYRVRRT